MRSAIMPVAALLDEGIIDRWARLFAQRYQTPARADEFAARIVGAIAAKPVLASAAITCDEELARVFDYARTVIEGYVGSSTFTVSGSILAANRADRTEKMRHSTALLPWRIAAVA